MKIAVWCIALSVCTMVANAQFPGPAGTPGTTAIYKDSAVFTGWATGCTIERGLLDISNPALGYVSHGNGTDATGIADGTGVVSLGDGGHAVLTFAKPIKDSAGWDFAVFENSYSDQFLELAFVEVSSDGIQFFRFPATSYTQQTVQLGGFGTVDATQIDNLAGKYRSLYGTPFDLQQLATQPGLNIQAITHVKIIDVVGCIQESYATVDQYGNKVNDPWSTPFASGGFDLDAVGVIHCNTVQTVDKTLLNNDIRVFPNPAQRGSVLHIALPSDHPRGRLKISLLDLAGRVVSYRNTDESVISVPVAASVQPGLYTLQIIHSNYTISRKVIIE